MRAYLNQTIVIPFPANQTMSAITIIIMKLSDGTRTVNGASMTSQLDNIWTYTWTVPKVVEAYQVIFNDGSFSYSGPIIEVGGGIVFTVLSDAGNSATQFKTDLTQSVNDHFIGPALVKWLTSTLIGQTRRLPSTSAYVGATGIVTVAVAFTSTPANG